jgi:AraC-like DNA-binding protein
LLASWAPTGKPVMLTALKNDPARRLMKSSASTVKTVTEIANDHGFGELGRFAVSYRKLYGEAPSVTLRRPPDSRGSIEIGRANRQISDSA